MDSRAVHSVKVEDGRRLTPEERHLLILYCSDHIVAQCLSCGLSFRLMELASELLGSRTSLCRTCHKDLTVNVRAHLYGCAMLPSEVRRRAQAVRAAAKHLVKQSQGLRDGTEVLMVEAKVAFFDARQALRDAISRRSRG